MNIINQIFLLRADAENNDNVNTTQSNNKKNLRFIKKKSLQNIPNEKKEAPSGKNQKKGDEEKNEKYIRHEKYDSEELFAFSFRISSLFMFVLV